MLVEYLLIGHAYQVRQRKTYERKVRVAVERCVALWEASC